jgi:hypothetical protein
LRFLPADDVRLDCERIVDASPGVGGAEVSTAVGIDGVVTVNVVTVDFGADVAGLVGSCADADEFLFPGGPVDGGAAPVSLLVSLRP